MTLWSNSDMQGTHYILIDKQSYKRNAELFIKPTRSKDRVTKNTSL